MNLLTQLDPIMIGILVAAAIAIVVIIRVVRRIARAARRADRRGAGSRFGFGLAVVVALGVAGVGGVTSFDAVAHRFNSPLIPLVVDGMVIACTALRLAAMTRGWRIPGALLTTYVFIAGSVIINMASVGGWEAKLGHALAPIAYALLVEFLAHLVRLKMKLAQPARARLSALTWFTSPVITTRMWLHMSRTGAGDPRQVRTLMQQVARTASRLAAVCPSDWQPVAGSRSPWRVVRDALRARAARRAALQTIRDELLTSAEVAALLPDDGHLSPGELLARLDRAAITPPVLPGPVAADTDPAVGPVRPAAALAVHRPASVTASAPVHPAASAAAPAAASESSAPAAPEAPDESAPVSASDSAPADADDDALVAFLHRHSADQNDGHALAIREVQRLISSGWSKAKRIHALTGWTDTDTTPAQDSQPKQERQLQLLPSSTNSQPNESQTELEESRA